MENYKSNKGEEKYPTNCRKKTGIMLSRSDRVVPEHVIECKRRISATAFSCEFDKNAENINQISSAPNVWAAKDNIQPFLKGDSLEDGVNDIFEEMRQNFDPKTFQI